MRKKLIATVLAWFLLLSFPVSAKEIVSAPYAGYEFNSSEESTAAPIGYIQTDMVNTTALGLETPLSNPSDMLYRDGFLYILDSGNSRILILNRDLMLSGIRDKFTDIDGSEIFFEGAQGFDLTDDRLYIADTEKNRILVFDGENRCTGRIVKRADHPDHFYP